jgi:hypothetical protein
MSNQVTYRLLTNYKVAPYNILYIVANFQSNQAEVDFPIWLVQCPFSNAGSAESMHDALCAAYIIGGNIIYSPFNRGKQFAYMIPMHRLSYIIISKPRCACY